MNGLTITTHNELIESSYQLNIHELRLINLALTQIDSRKKDVGKLDLYPDYYAKIYDIPRLNVWRDMKLATETIIKKPIKFKFSDEKGRKKQAVMGWLSYADWFIDEEDGSKLTIKFNSEIHPYLFELVGNFTKINFEYASKLTTPFSFRLYQWLVKQYIVNEDGMYSLTMSLAEIKKSAQLDGAYNEWRDFKKKVIDPAISAINTKTNLTVVYQVVKRGNKVHALEFAYIDETDTKQLSDFKPLRPRLSRRPKVSKGSHAENEWMKINFVILRDYQIALKKHDKTLKLTIPDLQKLIIYSKINGLKTYQLALKELKERTK